MIGRPSRLTDDQIRAIREDRRPYKFIARDYLISITYISQIKSAERAAHRCKK